MRVAITGATGFIGAALVDSLRARGDTVLRIGRPHHDAKQPPPDVLWDAREHIETEKLEGVDAVIHLAGESIAQRWTDDAKRKIRDSRVQGTTLIAKSIAALAAKPTVLVSVSAIGIYGDRGDEVVDESSPVGEDFLADVARLWERSADPARLAGIRVVHPRLGIVLHPGGGALAKLIPIFSLGGGGKIGSGRQWMSWIARRDVLAALAFAIDTPALEGAVNFTAPNAVTNAEFTETLARVLHRPAIVPVPEFAIKLLYGEMGESTVIAGQHVVPAVLQRARYPFAAERLEAGLRGEGVGS